MLLVGCPDGDDPVEDAARTTGGTDTTTGGETDTTTGGDTTTTGGEDTTTDGGDTTTTGDDTTTGEGTTTGEPPEDTAAQYVKLCSLCHGKDGEGYAADGANALNNPTFQQTATREYLVAAIERGRPGTTMSAWGHTYGGPMSQVEMEAMADYILAWGTEERLDVSAWVSEGEAERGQAHYDFRCRDCHGEMGQGGLFQSIANPEILANASDGFLRYAISKGRPNTSMVEFESVLTQQAIDDLVVLLRSWSTDPPGAPEELPELGDPVINPDGAEPAFAASGEHYLPLADLWADYDAGAKMIILDARPPADYVTEHVAGASSVPFYSVDQAVIDKLPKDTWIVCYCACPHAESDALAQALEAEGFDKVKVLNEGYNAWVDAGYPVNTGIQP